MGLAQRIAARRFRTAVARAVAPERWAGFGAGAIVHPPLDIDGRERVSVGDSTYVLSHARIVVGPDAHVSIGSRTYLGRDLVIVAHAAVEIGDDVMGSDRLLFADVSVVPGGERQLTEPRPVRIGDGVFLGTGAMVLAGVTVGEGSLVGAGAVVVSDVPPRSVVGGNPARVLRRWDGSDWVRG
jgi:acetyltransferase-like isoleucine patch superfamily enzyme